LAHAYEGSCYTLRLADPVAARFASVNTDRITLAVSIPDLTADVHAA
jgi:hypothetical protein